MNLITQIIMIMNKLNKFSKVNTRTSSVIMYYCLSGTSFCNEIQSITAARSNIYCSTLYFALNLTLTLSGQGLIMVQNYFQLFDKKTSQRIEDKTIIQIFQLDRRGGRLMLSIFSIKLGKYT